jgi:transposase
VTGANRHDSTQLELVLDEIIIDRPEDIEQHLCADKGYSGEPALQAITDRDYIPHVKQRGEEIQEKKVNPDYKARRWVVEVSHSWFNRFRKLLVRYENSPKHIGLAVHCRSYHRLKKNWRYLRIISKIYSSSQNRSFGPRKSLLEPFDPKFRPR